MPSIFEQIKNYNNDLNLKNGKVKDPYENFRIKNSENSIAIGDSEFGKIAFNRNDLNQGLIRCLTVGMTGSGKSFLTRNIIEKFTLEDTGIIVVIDPEGEYFSLRNKLDFIILGTDSKYCDIVVTEENMNTIALIVMKYKINIIIDVSIADSRLRQELVSIFIDTIIDNGQDSSPMQIIIEEASRFAKKGDQEKHNVKCTLSLKSLAQYGRKRQISTFYNTQRSTQLNPDIGAECGSYLIGRCIKNTDVERNSKLMDMTPKESRILKSLKYEFLAYGSGFDHSGQIDKPIKFKSDIPITKHSSSSNRKGNTLPEIKTKRVEYWYSILKQVIDFGKIKEGIGKKKEIEEVEFSFSEKQNIEEEPKLELQKPIEPKPVETSDLEKIIARFGTISFVDLSILLRLPYYNKIQISKMISDLNSRFINIENEEANYFGDEEFKFKFSSKPIVEYWKEQAKKIAPLIQYLYDSENDDNYLEDLKDRFLVEEYENLIRIIGERVYLNPILLFDKVNAGYSSAWNGDLEEDDFFDDEEDDD